MLKDSLIIHTQAAADKNQMFIGNGYRVTVVTSGIIRIETDKNNVFTDLPSTSFWFRKQENKEFSCIEKNGIIDITTEKIVIRYDLVAEKLLSVFFKSKRIQVTEFEQGNLFGTCRTLDHTKGPVKLEKGLISRNGVSVIDDSKSFLINKEGMFEKRKSKGRDIYIFAYLNEPRQCLKDFFKLSGKVPLVPRFALGVWWSRYRQYTQQEYIELIDRFKKENIPLTVATVDMDWHWTDLNKQFNTNYERRTDVENTVTGGWTGYSWNTELFPDYRAFLSYLKSKNLRVTLNLHPADGVRFFEDCYEEMAMAMGIDPKTKKDIPFQVGNDRFWNNYFDILHKPYEKEGVDFWWIDWQQGKKSDVPGLDPLIPLNHYHYLDNAQDGRLPLILSRYSGLGSHRYPLGFSGDTDISWKVLAFQPYFTANSSNSGYTWWSHDIGGHHQGVRDEELYIRWIQFGVFSPIMRLHSTSDDLLGKEPWKYTDTTCALAKKLLRLRHSLVPFLYTADYMTHKHGTPICQPMYYEYPECEEAYSVANQYIFASSLIVAPIVSPNDRELLTGKCEVWLPEGTWTDIFTGKMYSGNKKITMHRELSSIPVLARQGAVIPMTDDTGNGADNPNSLRIMIFNGNSDYDLYEDDSSVDFESHSVITSFCVRENANSLTFTVKPAKGDLSVIPEKRDYNFEFRNIKAGKIKVYADGKEVTDYDVCVDGFMTLSLGGVCVKTEIEITVKDFTLYKGESMNDALIKIMSRWQARNLLKSRLYKPMKNVTDAERLRKIIEQEKELPEKIKEVLYEILS